MWEVLCVTICDVGVTISVAVISDICIKFLVLLLAYIDT